MKKLFLLLAAGAVALNVGAQEIQHATVNTLNPVQDRKIDAAALRNALNQKNAGAQKTTAVAARWYNYGDAIDTSANAYFGSYNQNTALGTTEIWADTFGKVNYTSGLVHLTDVCEAAVFDPKAAIFNSDPGGAYNGLMWIKGSDAYVWDSVDLFGVYDYNATKTTVVDTLRLVFTFGSGGSKSSDNIFGGSSLAGGGHYGTISFLDVSYDSVKNTMVGSQTANLYPSIPPYHVDYYLKSADWADTNSHGIWSHTYPTNGASGISVPAGANCAMSITFVSGDPARNAGGILSSTGAGDTLIGTYLGSGKNKYNVWRPLVSYYATYSGGNPTPAFAPATCPAYEPFRADQNLGYWKRLPNYSNGWENLFLPTWAWTSGSGAATIQYPYIAWHVSVCTTCGTVSFPAVLGTSNISVVNSVTAYPNPAEGNLNISFDLSAASNITVSLTNMLGQVVATQKVDNKATGSVIFNTAALSSGIYIYTLTSNGNVTTGRVTIAH
jgi:hypothetical protein